MENISVDKDILDFLKYIYFGAVNNCYKAASQKAYLDMCRTIRFNHIDVKELRGQIDTLIEKEIRFVIDNKITNQSQYDDWHFNLCNMIVEAYRNNKIDFYIGQSQKWVNMTMKYLYVIGDINMDGIFKYLHIPLDNFIFNAVKRELKISIPKKPWSRITDYKGCYIPYQNAIREAINIPPLRWEFSNWLSEAKKQYGK